jgi:hypothetical protein
MNMRKKPIPNPIARPTEVRPLSPARPRAVLPTVAALLAMAAIGCEQPSESIKRDESIVAVGNTLSQAIDHTIKAPRHHDPSEPLPALGIIEQPPPPPPAPPPPAPTTHPYPVKGGMKAVHPIPPIKKPVKLGGDVAPAFPETT